VVRIEGQELRNFLGKLDDFATVFRQAERRLRDARVVEVLASPALLIDTKADFTNKQNVNGIAQALKLVKVDAEMRPDEEHSAWSLVYRDGTNAEREIGVELAQQAEYKRLRALSKDIGRYNHPPFTAVRNENREVLASWRDLLGHVKAEGMKDSQVTRYKGLGEMNAEQLWDTTMHPEKRTLLQVRMEDMVECEEMFSTLMGENVESRRKFIEENALDVRNLDV
jgi:DNA gyrase subunit B